MHCAQRHAHRLVRLVKPAFPPRSWSFYLGLQGGVCFCRLRRRLDWAVPAILIERSPLTFILGSDSFHFLLRHLI